MQLYDTLADWWPLMSPPGNYAAEADAVARLLFPDPPPRRTRVLELGAGGGHLASHLAADFDMTLVDLSPRMLDQSRRLNPGCRHLQGDMRHLRLAEVFDAVLIFDAIGHMTTAEDLLAALRTARAHLVPGGAALFCPDWTTERFTPGTSTGGTDGPGRGMRYLEWTQAPDTGTTYRVDLAYLLRDPDGSRRVVHDQMTLGLFPRATWQRLLADAGFCDIAVALLSGRDVFRVTAC